MTENTPIIIRPYATPDRMKLIQCLEGLQDYLVALDSVHLLHRPSYYGEEYTRLLLARIEKENGMIYLAEKEKEVVGVIAGIIKEQSEKQKLEDIPYLEGNIMELYVEASIRNSGIGTKLINTMEEFFLAKGCGVFSIGVMAANHGAHRLYQKMGYADREIYMVKRIP